MENEEIQKSAEEKIEKARIIESFLNSKEWEIIRPIIINSFREHTDGWNEAKCRECEGKAFHKKVYNVLQDIVNQSEEAQKVVDKFNNQ